MPFSFNEDQTDGNLIYDFLFQTMNLLKSAIHSDGFLGFSFSFLPEVQPRLKDAWNNDWNEQFSFVLGSIERDIPNLEQTFPRLERVGLRGRSLRAKLFTLQSLSERFYSLLDFVKRGLRGIQDLLDKTIDKIFNLVNSLLSSLIAASTGGIVDPLEACKEIKDLIHNAIDFIFPSEPSH